VIVETVGVGQSEAAVAGMTDVFVLMQLPNAGDDLQAIKKGVLELADLVVVNKADLDAAAAARAVGQLESALQLAARPRDGEHGRRCSRRARSTPARCASSPMRRSRGPPSGSAGGAIGRRRERQSRAWLQERIDAGSPSASGADPRVQALLPATLAEVDAGRLPVSVRRGGCSTPSPASRAPRIATS
jgi:LAO/AO transport system kinase